MSEMNTPNPALAERLWQRHTLGQKLARTAFWLGIGIAVLLSLRNINVIWEFLWDAPEQMLDMVQRMFPPDYAYYRVAVHTALMETFHIATLGTIFALVAALPLSILAAHNLTPNRGLNFFAKTMLVASRSVNSLVWALLFIAVFGPGPLAGTAAIACRSVGFVGKLLGEALEEVPRGPIEALKAAGATQSSQILYGYWPAVKPAFWSIMLLRWDINVRESSVLGLVGAGGIGSVKEHLSGGQRVRDDGQGGEVLQLSQGLGECQRGGPGRQRQGVPGADHGGRRLADAALDLQVEGRLGGESRFEGGGAGRHRSAVDTFNQSLGDELGDVTAHGHLGDPQLIDDVGHADPAGGRDPLQDVLLALTGEHRGRAGRSDGGG